MTANRPTFETALEVLYRSRSGSYTDRQIQQRLGLDSIEQVRDLAAHACANLGRVVDIREPGRPLRTGHMLGLVGLRNADGSHDICGVIREPNANAYCCVPVSALFAREAQPED